MTVVIKPDDRTCLLCHIVIYKIEFMKQLRCLSFIVLMITVFSACRTSRITTSWNAPSPLADSSRRVLVLALLKDPDRQLRERMEDHLAGDLTELGYTALAATRELGPKTFENMDEKTALASLKNMRIDAVVTIVLLDEQKERTYVAPQVYSGYFWHYYDFRYGRMMDPGYYVTDTRYFWETNLYEMPSQALKYSAQTRSFSPSSAEALGHEYGRLMITDMVKKHVLINRKADAN